MAIDKYLTKTHLLELGLDGNIFNKAYIDNLDSDARLGILKAYPADIQGHMIVEVCINSDGDIVSITMPNECYKNLPIIDYD